MIIGVIRHTADDLSVSNVKYEDQGNVCQKGVRHP